MPKPAMVQVQNVNQEEGKQILDTVSEIRKRIAEQINTTFNSLLDFDFRVI